MKKFNPLDERFDWLLVASEESEIDDGVGIFDAERYERFCKEANPQGITMKNIIEEYEDKVLDLGRKVTRLQRELNKEPPRNWWNPNDWFRKT